MSEDNNDNNDSRVYVYHRDNAEQPVPHSVEKLIVNPGVQRLDIRRIDYEMVGEPPFFTKGNYFA